MVVWIGKNLWKLQNLEYGRRSCNSKEPRSDGTGAILGLLSVVASSRTLLTMQLFLAQQDQRFHG